MRSVLRAPLSLLIVSLIACAAIAEPVESVDSTAIRDPQKPKPSLGEVLLDIPSYLLKSPFLLMEQVSSGVVHIATGNSGGPNILQVFTDPLRVFTPIIAYGSHSGLGGGFRWRPRAVLDTLDQLRVRATYSTNSYSLVDVKYINPAIAGGRLGVRTGADYRRATRVSYFGPGNESDLSQEVSYTLERTSVSAELDWRPLPSVTLGTVGAWQAFGMFDGHQPDLESRLSEIQTRFGLTPEALRSADFLMVGGQLDIDIRNHPARPTAGGRYTLDIDYNRGVGDDDQIEFLKTRVELSHYLDVWQRRVLAFRAVIQDIDRSNDVAPNPIYLQSGLGGHASLRSYYSSRFVDRDMALVNLEYRYPVWDIIDAFLFLDEGRVFNRLGSEFTLAEWHHSAGFGLRVWNDEDVVGMLTIAAGKEGARIFFEFGQVF